MAVSGMSAPNLDRYSRQILFRGIGKEGQEKLLASRVVVIGCGALGTVQANALVRAGVGTVIIADRDFVEENNLQRQILFDEEDIREKLPKAVAAQEKLAKINSGVKVEALVTDVNYKNIEMIIRGADLVLDGVDNFETRFLLNDACHKSKIPWIYGACIGSYGISMTVIPGKTACVRCLFDTAPPPGLSPTCDTAGILSSTVNIVASAQVAEAMKLLTGRAEALRKGVLAFDLWSNMFRTLGASMSGPLKECPVCGGGKYEYLEAEDRDVTFATSLCGRNAVQVTRTEGKEVSFAELAEKMGTVGEVKHNAFILSAKIDEYEISVFKDGRAIIKGTHDPAVAKSVYSKYVGS